jgi:RNA-dependent RNA polymerase
MFPDHTGLLESGEVFVAVGDGNALCEIELMGKIIAIRNPSYFADDIRKLKAVSQNELTRRCATRGQFFRYVKTGIFFSTKGQKSEAEMMSGGDFDGDKGT